jgi:hypothetical protein
MSRSLVPKLYKYVIRQLLYPQLYCFVLSPLTKVVLNPYLINIFHIHVYPYQPMPMNISQL